MYINNDILTYIYIYIYMLYYQLRPSPWITGQPGHQVQMRPGQPTKLRNWPTRPPGKGAAKSARETGSPKEYGCSAACAGAAVRQDETMVRDRLTTPSLSETAEVGFSETRLLPRVVAKNKAGASAPKVQLLAGTAESAKRCPSTQAEESACIS